MQANQLVCITTQIRTGCHQSDLATVVLHEVAIQLVTATTESVLEKRGRYAMSRNEFREKRRLHAVKGTCNCNMQAHPITADSAVQADVTFSDCAVQTDVLMKTFSGLQEELIQLKVKNHDP